MNNSFANHDRSNSDILVRMWMLGWAVFAAIAVLKAAVPWIGFDRMSKQFKPMAEGLISGVETAFNEFYNFIGLPVVVDLPQVFTSVAAWSILILDVAVLSTASLAMMLGVFDSARRREFLQIGSGILTVLFFTFMAFSFVFPFLPDWRGYLPLIGVLVGGTALINLGDRATSVVCNLVAGARAAN